MVGVGVDYVGKTWRMKMKYLGTRKKRDSTEKLGNRKTIAWKLSFWILPSFLLRCSSSPIQEEHLTMEAFDTVEI